MPSSEAKDIIRMMTWYGDNIVDKLDEMEASGASEDSPVMIAGRQTLVVLEDLIEIIALDDHINFDPASFTITAPDDGFTIQ